MVALMLCFVRRPLAHFLHNIKHDLIFDFFFHSSACVAVRPPVDHHCVLSHFFCVCVCVAYRIGAQRCDETQCFASEAGISAWKV